MGRTRRGRPIDVREERPTWMEDRGPLGEFAQDRGAGICPPVATDPTEGEPKPLNLKTLLT